MNRTQDPSLTAACDALADLSAAIEPDDEWPARQLAILAEHDVLGWVIPKEYGGGDIGSGELTRVYAELASACLVTTFILTQRNGACQRVAGCENESLKATRLPDWCAGKRFPTVGISHLTTSRQHIAKPAVAVTERDSEFILDGEIPWVTGAPHADDIITGGTCADGRQVLIAMPTDLPGINVKVPPRLLALNASHTGAVGLEGVAVPKEFLVAGPVENVMSHGTGGGTGSLTTSALAIGHASAAIARIEAETEKRNDLREVADEMAREHTELRDDLEWAMDAASETSDPRHSAESIRQRSNSLVLRATQAYLAACKGAGFLSSHSAQRAVREAMFFLVWSCPQSVLAAQLREFACVE